MALEAPPRRALGDLAVPIAFALARRLKKAPRVIAQELAARPRHDRRHRAHRSRAERLSEFLPRSRRCGCAAGPAPAAAASGSSTAPTARPSSSTRPSTRTRRRTSAICETPRSATPSAGCCAFRDARSRSRTTSTTPASRSPTSSSAFASWSIAAWTRCARSPTTTRFDYYCWDLYAQGHGMVRAGQERVSSSGRTPCTPSSAAATRPRRWPRSSPTGSCARTSTTMRRMNIGYDLLTWEGDILRLHFWAHAFEYPEEDAAPSSCRPKASSRAAGSCGSRTSQSDAGRRSRAEAADEEPEEQREKVIVRSDGTVTYVGKDMAYQFWKFGLLGRDFHYRVVRPARRRQHAVVDDVGATRERDRRARVRSRARWSAT